MRAGVAILLLAQLAGVAWCQQDSISVASQSDFNNILNVNIQCASYKLPEVDQLLEKTRFPPVATRARTDILCVHDGPQPKPIGDSAHTIVQITERWTPTSWCNA